jgi:hypothetical protein
MKSSLHSLIPFLPLFCQLPTPELNSLLRCNFQLFVELNFRLPAHLELRNSTQFSWQQQPTISILIPAAWDSRNIVSGRTHRKHRFPYCCMLIHCCRDVFTAQLRSNESRADTQKTPLATPLLLLRDITAYVTRSFVTCVQVITEQRLFLCVHSSYFEKIRHILIIIIIISSSSSSSSNLFNAAVSSSDFRLLRRMVEWQWVINCERFRRKW